MSKKISVIIPCYNAGKVLTRCLDSILEQSYSNKEILLVNDGSVDDTAAICDEYAAKMNCIRVVHQENAGVSAARNTALNIATGEYITFVDSDDTADPEYLQNLMRWSEYDFVTAGYSWQTSDLSWREHIFPDKDASIDNLKKQPSVFMGKYYFGSPWATLMKRALIEKAHLRFNTEIHSGEDTLFIFQYLQNASSIKIVPQCGYNYFYYPGSLVHTRHSDYWKWKIIIESTIMNFFEPCDEHEYLSLIQRNFDVLRDLLRDYSKQMSQGELYSLYRHVFFEECIAHKKANGSFTDRTLIFSMEHKNYAFYTKVMKMTNLYQRIIRRIKRVFHRKAEAL